MIEIDKKRVKAFKKEYEAYLLYSDLIKDCEERLEEIERMVGLHSPNLTGLHYSGIEQDKKLLRYTQLRAPILAKLSRYRSEIERVNKILTNMQEWAKNVLKMSFTGISTYEEMSPKFYMSEYALKYAVDKAILEAINAVDSTMHE